jgi:hypothetical protein
MKTTKTVNLTVTLDKTAIPPVVISCRKQLAAPGDTVRWQKQDPNDDFDITDFEPVGVGEAFQDMKTGGNGQWLSVVFSPDKTSWNYPYTLTVTSGDDEYTSDEPLAFPDDRRAVIRNGP